MSFLYECENYTRVGLIKFLKKSGLSGYVLRFLANFKRKKRWNLEKIYKDAGAYLEGHLFAK